MRKFIAGLSDGWKIRSSLLGEPMPTKLTTEDEVLAGGALAILEREGWICHVREPAMGLFVCSLSKGHIRALSRPHFTRTGAVGDAVCQAHERFGRLTDGR